MCHFASGVLTRFDVFYSDKSDSHTEILEEYGIGDFALLPGFVEFELIPPNDGDWDDLENWDFVVRQDRVPRWFNYIQDASRARAMLSRCFPEGFKKGFSVMGNLNLERLTCLPDNIRISAGGNVNLGGLISLPNNVKLSAGDSLYLGRVTSLSDNAELLAKGNLSLGSLSSLPNSIELSAGRNLNLKGLTSLPDNSKLSVGGNLNLGGLTSLPNNVKLSVRGDLYLGGLTSLPDNAELSAGNNLFLGIAMRGKKLPVGVKIEAGHVFYE